jgi:hypothetical protein
MENEQYDYPNSVHDALKWRSAFFRLRLGQGPPYLLYLDLP